MAFVKSVIHGIEDFDYNHLNDEAAPAQVKIVEASVRVEEDCSSAWTWERNLSKKS
jgi:hypothetical protein